MSHDTSRSVANIRVLRLSYQLHGLKSESTRLLAANQSALRDMRKRSTYLFVKCILIFVWLILMKDNIFLDIEMKDRIMVRYICFRKKHVQTKGKCHSIHYYSVRILSQ